MTPNSFRLLTWLLAALTLALLILAVVTLYLMRLQANKRLSTGDQISYSIPMVRWDHVTELYRRVCPDGRAYLVWKVSVIGATLTATIIILFQAWLLMGKNN